METGTRAPRTHEAEPSHVGPSNRFFRYLLGAAVELTQGVRKNVMPGWDHGSGSNCAIQQTVSLSCILCCEKSPQGFKILTQKVPFSLLNEGNKQLQTQHRAESGRVRVTRQPRLI